MDIALISIGILVCSGIFGGLAYILLRFAAARMWRTPIEALIDLDNDAKRLSSFGFDAERLGAPAIEPLTEHASGHSLAVKVSVAETEPEPVREGARPMEHAA